MHYRVNLRNLAEFSVSNMPDYAWVLKMPEYARVLNMSQYA